MAHFASLAESGVVKKAINEKGYGFIAVDGGGVDLFFHVRDEGNQVFCLKIISFCEATDMILQDTEKISALQRVTFFRKTGRQGKPCAFNVKPARRQSISSSSCSSSLHSSRKDTVTAKPTVNWSFQSDVGFQKYSFADCSALESAFQAGREFVLVCNGLYQVNISNMTQRNVLTGYPRKVHRDNTSAPVEPSCSPGRLQWSNKVSKTTFVTTGGESVRRYSILGDPGSGNSRDVYEYNMAFAHFLRLTKGMHGKSKIARIDVYENAGLAERFERERARLASIGAEEQIWVFHGTRSESVVKTIMLEGFKVGGTEGVPLANGAVHGAGIYTAKGPDTPMQYAEASGCVILALALPGRSLRSGASSAHEGGDSWHPRGDWVVFRRGEQLLPVYVVHFEADGGQSFEAPQRFPSASPPIFASGGFSPTYPTSGGQTMGSMSSGGFTPTYSRSYGQSMGSDSQQRKDCIVM